MGVPLVIILILDGFFPDKPSSYWGTPFFMESPISFLHGVLSNKNETDASNKYLDRSGNRNRIMNNYHGPRDLRSQSEARNVGNKSNISRAD